MRRWLIRGISVSLSLLAILIIAGFLLMPEGSEDVLQRIDSSKIKFTRVEAFTPDSLVVGGYVFGDSSKRPLLLIHGSPGDWSAWVNTIVNDQILANYYVIAMDRPGYGLTNVPGQATLKAQSEAARILINQLRLDRLVVVGHSYGGAVVEQLLVDHDDIFELAILVAPTVSPGHMEPRWYNKIADWSFVQPFLSKELHSSNLEMNGLPASLRAIEAQVASIQTAIVFLQGTDDVLVPFASVGYFKKVKPYGVEYFLYEGMNHFIPWTNPDLINDKLVEYTKK